jgi:DNA-binding NtrC family response regulator
LPDLNGRTPAILVVEDELLLRMAISDYLQECGFKIYEAVTASEAIEMIESGRFVIDLVFSDVRTPGKVDGFGLAQWVRKNRPGLPVILTSGDAKKSEVAKALCENEPMFEKPYDLDLVLAHIRTVMAQQKRTCGGD